VNRVLQALDRRLDPNASAPVTVAFSGGSDSLALLLLARAWADRAGRSVLALTVDHGLQAQSGAWTQAAAAVAAQVGVGFRALDWTGPKPASGVPAAARAARHRLLAVAAREAGAACLLIGHTFDDQLENALMRGAGERLGPLRPWSPSPVWPEGRELFLCRPLLAERRADLQAWLAGQGWSWIDDPANDNPVSPRARARARIAGGEAGDCDDPTEDPPALAAMARLCRAPAWGGLVLPRAALVEGPALRLLQIALACASGREALPRPARALPLLQRLRAGEVFTASLGGARLEAGRGEVLIVREPGEFQRGADARRALDSGETLVWDGRIALTAWRPGLTAGPLRGLAARLTPAERAGLAQIPAAGRGALPAVQALDLPPSCPMLEASPARAFVGATSLVWARFSAACGLIRQEGETSCAALMADSRQPSYVIPGAKGLSE